ncbi:MAG: VOC family protein [Porphyromonadaceae bacterium]|nr:MAG: VOC family protein [Porphyromonadaceae bacterium]
MKNNVVGWFEIPVADMDRAIKFYETVFEFKIDRNQLGSLDMGWFPWEENGLGSGGSLVYHPDHYNPSKDGTLVYFTAQSGDLQNELSRVVPAGGKVLAEKRLIAEGYGYLALVLDTEGNRIALHSRE